MVQDKNAGTGFNGVDAAKEKRAAAVKVMKQNQNLDERFERETFNLPLLIGRNPFLNRSFED
jgi:hypothetical protein